MDKINKEFVLKFDELLRKKECLELFSINNFIPKTSPAENADANGNAIKKIKFRIPFPGFSTWNVIEPFIDIIRNDDKYELLLILANGADLDRRILKCNDLNIKYELHGISRRDYIASQDKPDIFLLYDMSDQCDYGDLRKYTKFIIAVCSHINSEEYGREDYWNFLTTKSFGKYQPDYFVFDKLLYKIFTSGTPIANNLIEMGNPKFDTMYKTLKNFQPLEKWSKLRGKKVLCYCPDHGIYDYYIHRNTTFAMYGPAIFKWASQDANNVGLIFRPHPTLIIELLRHNIWTKEDLSSLKNYIAQSSNIVWDDNLSYNAAFATGDAILTDAYCGITCTALPTGKPLGALYQKKELQPVHPEISNALYEIKSRRELNDFLMMIQNNKDPMKKIREQACQKYLCSFDGLNTQRIMQFIETKFFEKFPLTMPAGNCA